MEIPSQAIVAAGEIATDAARTIFGAVRRRLDAWSAVKSAEDEANADEIKQNIRLQGDIKREQEAQSERHAAERRELDHLIDMSSLAYRGFRRLGEQVADEQKRIEWVSQRSIGIANAEGMRSESREISDDWLKRFFKYAADVDEGEILELLARGLADAAMRDRPILSPKALDTLRFFEHSSFMMFDYSMREISVFGQLPQHMLENRSYVNKREMDVVLLIELGLLKEERQKHFTARLGNAYITFSYDSGVNGEFRTLDLTYVGKSISCLIERKIQGLAEGLRKCNISASIAEKQIYLGIDEAAAGSLARYLIAQIGDTENIDVKATIIKDERSFDVLSTRRISAREEFRLSEILAADFSDHNTKLLMSAFVNEFTDFDKNQLPFLYTDDIP